MASLKSLAKDTAIYGMSSIVGRFLNYLLFPLYTHVFAAASGGNGVITNMYSYTALLFVILTFGMETTLFRFINRDDVEDPKKVYTTVLAIVGGVGLLFFALVLAFLPGLSAQMGYPDHPDYVWMMAAVVALDAFQAVPFCYLRYQRRPVKFAVLKLSFIALNIILVLGIAGILNQTIDKILFPKLVPGHEGIVQLGIYGGAVKIAMIMALITQAFRYAYEPFVFAAAKKSESTNNRATYALTMKYFLIFTLFAFLMVMAYIDVFKHMMGRDYWEGLKTVAIVMVGEIVKGVYFNLSFWYKLTDRTIWGAWFSGAGCLVLVACNLLFVPRFGYMACAWSGVAGYTVAMLLSYFTGQKYYPIAYPLKQIFAYVGLTAVLYAVMSISRDFIGSDGLRIAFNSIGIVLFLVYTVRKDFPLASLPVIGKYFRK